MALQGKRALIVASTGGHLTQAASWKVRLRLDGASSFVTFKSEQSLSLTSGSSALFVPYVAPRDARGVLRAARMILRATRTSRYDLILSTGAGLALAALPAAVLRRIPYFYIESVSRFDGPSVTGRVLEWMPWIARFTQHPGYSPRRWTEIEPLLTDYGLVAGSATAFGSLRVFVTLGTIRPYTFVRAVQEVLAALEPGDQVVWQLGETHVSDLPGEVNQYMNAKEFNENVACADVVITHAGVGTILATLNAGKLPVLFVRDPALGEHVDNHQSQVAQRLEDLGLAVQADGRLTRATLLTAASSKVEHRDDSGVRA
jgi:UDP-N-acetylglucosamine--N-acetylmuramyl-(pentapeptide) pyrophosphoryl-undecaprenol N-acetylglucosamine transferase